MSKLNDLLTQLLGAVLVGLTASRMAAQETTVRLIAADRDQPTLVSELVDFRQSPYGGLIACQWIAPQVNGKSLCPVTFTARAADLALSPGVTLDLSSHAAAEIEGLGADPTATDAESPDDPTVDPLYRDKTFAGSAIGPLRQRHSSGTFTGAGELWPGGRKLARSPDPIDVPCSPVAIRAGTTLATAGDELFAPRLTWRSLDLLADCLFEYSEQMPLGDLSVLPAEPTRDDRIKLQIGMAAGARRFRELILYLPASEHVPYELNDMQFFLTADGNLRVTDHSANERGEQLRLGNDGKSLILLQPAADEKDRPTVPLQLDTGGRQVSIKPDTATLPVVDGRVSLTVETGDGWQTRFLDLPDRLHWLHAVAQLIAPTSAAACLRLVATPEAGTTASGQLRLHIAQTAAEPIALPESFAGSLTPLRQAADDQRIALTFAVDDDVATADCADAPPGLYLLSLALAPVTELALPVVIVPPDTRAAATLSTYHNREDFERGEELQVLLQLRGDRDRTTLQLELRHERGSIQRLAPVEATTAGTFLRLPTAQLPLGEFQLSVTAAGVISHGLRFRLFPAQPRSTFVTHQWHRSFCTPVKAGRRLAVNTMMGESPLSHFSPTEVTELTRQALVPPAFRDWLAADDLFPAPVVTIGYDEPEAEMAACLRLGVRYAPHYGWGLNSQEKDWNPKHTLPEDLARIRRLCSLVTQRYRDFGNFAGLQLNWYPSFGGNWESHPPMDGNQQRRNRQLAREVSAVGILTEPLAAAAEKLATLGPDDPAYRSDEVEAVRQIRVAQSTYRTAALSRAYDAWTRRARGLDRGAGQARLRPEQNLPSLTYPDQPVYLSNVPAGWFDMLSYYPPTYFASLPVAGVHAYTDYGWAPFHLVWSIDYYGGGLGSKPIWATTMSNGGAVLQRHALLGLARGADALSMFDVDPPDVQTRAFAADFLERFGPACRLLQPHSDIAILASYKQQINEGKLAGKWMGYSGGEYFKLFTELWQARRPPEIIMDHEVTAGRLHDFKGIFLVNQRVPLTDEAMAALTDFAAAGGRIFKDEKTAAYYPGQTFRLESQEVSKWEPDKYKPTKDQFFVGTAKGYENIAASLDQLLAALPPPTVTSDTHNTLVATMTGKAMTVAFAVNDQHTWPGIYHPTWNFWHARIMPVRAKLFLDREYVVYDLLAGGRQIPLSAVADRFEMPVTFARADVGAYLLLEAPLEKLNLTATTDASGWTVLDVAAITGGRVLPDPLPCEITVLNAAGATTETLYRGLGPGHPGAVRIPATGTSWTVRVRELASGLTAAAALTAAEALPAVSVEPVLVLRPDDLRTFFAGPQSPRALGDVEAARHDPMVQVALPDVPPPPPSPKLFTIVVDPRDPHPQAVAHLQQALAASGREVRVWHVETTAVQALPLRYSLNRADKAVLAAAISGQTPVCAVPLAHQYAGESGSDFIDPRSGYGEPGPKHRFHSQVILVGSCRHNRFLADLHETVGQRFDQDQGVPGTALVQVVFDGFTPYYDVLSIQAADETGLAHGVERALSYLDAAATVDAAVGERQSAAVSADTRAELAAATAALGKSVSPSAVLADGGILVASGMTRSNYLLLNPQGEVSRNWLGLYGLKIGATGKTFWIDTWWSDIAFVDYVVRATPDLELQWMMRLPRFTGHFQYWQHPGSRVLTARDNDDIFVGGAHQALRLGPDGRVRWRFDDMPQTQTVYDFRFPRDVMLHAVSPNGKRLLVAAFGIEPYAQFASKFIRPTVMVLDAASGAIVWQLDGWRIDQSVGQFVDDDRVLLGDATDGKRRLGLFDLQQGAVWQLERPEGISAAQVSRDGRRLLVRPQAERDRLFKELAPPRGVSHLDLDTGASAELPLAAPFHAWARLPGTERVVISLDDGALCCYDLDGQLVWQQQFDGPCTPRAGPRDGVLLAGTPTGKLLWLTADGELQQELDMMPYNLVDDPDAYVAEYTRSPAGTPIKPALPEPVSIQERCGKAVRFSPNLLPQPETFRQLPAATSQTFEIAAEQSGTYLFVLQQRAATATDLVVTISDANGALANAKLPGSEEWTERLVGWRGSGSVKITVENGAADIAVRQAGVYRLTMPTANLLRQEDKHALPTGGLDELLQDDVDSELMDAGLAVEPPDVSYKMPDDVDLKARSRGAKPFKPKVWPDLPFDGKVLQDNTSWLSASIAGKCTHATMTMDFKKPVNLAALAIWEDAFAPGRLTTRYAVFARDLKTGQMRKLGHVLANGNGYNLFTFPAVATDQIVYLWLSSQDGHARVAELEAFGPPGQEM